MFIPIAVGVMAMPVMGALYYQRRFKADAFYGPLFPGVVVTALGAIALVGSYLWVFQQGTCDSRSAVACMVNQNQGVLTFVALVIAVVGLWTSVVTAAATRKRNEKEARDRTATAVRDSIQELYHNLEHVTGAYRGNQLMIVPQITMDSTLALFGEAHRLRLAPQVVNAIEPMRRNAERLRDL